MFASEARHEETVMWEKKKLDAGLQDFVCRIANRCPAMDSRCGRSSLVCVFLHLGLKECESILVRIH